MYISKNPKTKKQLKQMVKDHLENNGEPVRVFQPNGDIMGVKPPRNGEASIEGPHFPKPHRWYARATIKDGIVVKVQ